MPSASATDAMVLAVNMPAQLPSVGQALRSMSDELLVGQARPAAWAPDRLEHADDVEGLAPAARPGRIDAAVEEDRWAG